MRYFLAVNFSSEFKIQLLNQIHILQQTHPKLKWIREDNIHITIKFFGEIEKEKLDCISESLEFLQCSKFKLSTNSLIGAFPKLSNPRVIWVGISDEARKKLVAIYDQVEEISDKCGFPKEKRKFSPHLTIARVPKYLQIKSDFWSSCKNVSKKEISNLVDSIQLMQSVLKPQGAEYSIIKEYALN